MIESNSAKIWRVLKENNMLGRWLTATEISDVADIKLEHASSVCVHWVRIHAMKRMIRIPDSYSRARNKYKLNIWFIEAGGPITRAGREYSPRNSYIRPQAKSDEGVTA